MKIYCAGAGTFPTVTDMVGVFSGLDLFTSFFDIKDAKTFAKLRKHRPTSVVCDSGAHGFFSAGGSGVKTVSAIKSAAKLPAPRKYVEQYAQMISETLPFVECFVELDTVQMHGAPFQKWQRAVLLDACKGDRNRLMPVWHACEPMRTLYKLVDEWPYIALEGWRNRNLDRRVYLNIVKRCYDRQVKVHVFGSVDKDFLTNVPVYSSDSSSWSMIYRSGMFMRFNGRKLQTVHRSEVYKYFGRALGNARALARMKCDRATVFRYRELIRTVLEQYGKFAQYLTDLWTARGIVWS